MQDCDNERVGGSGIMWFMEKGFAGVFMDLQESCVCEAYCRN
jgi:hypothetical protein